MPHHQALLDDPVGTLRGLWNDTGWRAALLGALLIFLLETFMEIGNGEPGGSVGWTAILVSLLLIGRVLTFRPLRGDLLDTENLSLLLGLGGLLTAEVLVTYASLGSTFAAEPIYWPFSLLLGGVVLAARAIAPYAARPLVCWWLLFNFFVFWLHIATWEAQAELVEPPFTWGVALTFLAIICRWIAGRGLGGVVTSPLNVALAIYIFLAWWLEYGVDISGIGADPWGLQELYWPWLVFTVGLSAGAGLVAPRVTALFERNAP
ncbi:MAG: hypothetical protein F4Y69_00930 [Chloroflexi bacterium]|nr:hypothetical protein [Chloroflexota bacterium]MYB23198.1 hypothetical protein [Chloroflexota bacterium]MYF22642.1 hypothetical protein [Chloroflexota bacterium]MYI04586.1 hypothetical protein [Chloroflexota bacterium]